MIALSFITGLILNDNHSHSQPFFNFKVLFYAITGRKLDLGQNKSKIVDLKYF